MTLPLGQSLPARCVRARESASLALDDELSALQAAALQAHLRDCPACSTFMRSAAATTSKLREAALEQPSAPFVFAPAPRRVVRGVAAAGAVAASIAVAFAAGSLTARLHAPSRQPTARTASSIAATQEPYVEHRLLVVLARRPETRKGRVLPL